MSHLINEINQLEAVLQNIRREHQRAVGDLRTSTGELRAAEDRRRLLQTEVGELSDTINELTATLTLLKRLNERNGG